MSVMGTTIPQFELPVCNKFEPHVLDGRLCYLVDVNKIKDQVDPEKAMKTGLIFALDYNKERMLAEEHADEKPGLTHNLYELQNNDEKEKLDLATIHIETLGRVVQKIDLLEKTPFLSFPSNCFKFI